MPESTSSNIAPGNIPNLPIPPHGVEVYTDLARQKSFTVLHFKHGGGDRAAVLLWIGKALDQLAPAGLSASGPCDIDLTPDVAGSTSAKTKWRCYLKVPVELPANL